MAKIQLPPQKESLNNSEPQITKASEKKISDVINKGGSTTKQAIDTTEEVVFKNFNIKILDSEIETINKLREQRPKQRGQKRLSISIHDWIIEAIQNKIAMEKKKFKL